MLCEILQQVTNEENNSIKSC